MESDYPFLKKLGLNISNFSHGQISLTVQQNLEILSARHPQKSALPALRFTLTDIDQLAALVANKSMPEGDKFQDLASSEQGLPWDKIDAGTVAKLRQGLFRHVVKLGDVPQSLKTEIARHFMPMPVSVFAASDITIKSGTTFVIGKDDHDPVVCDFGTVTLEEGGQILIEAPAMINVQKFTKIPAA